MDVNHPDHCVDSNAKVYHGHQVEKEEWKHLPALLSNQKLDYVVKGECKQEQEEAGAQVSKCHDYKLLILIVYVTFLFVKTWQPIQHDKYLSK